MGLTYAGLYAASTSFAVTWAPKPFDGVVLGFLGLAAASMRRPAWMAGWAFLACWTDERSLVALCFIGLLAFWWPGSHRRERLGRLAMLAGAVLLYAVLRWLAFRALGWQSPDSSWIGADWKTAWPFVQLAAWTCFEAGWILIVWAAWRMRQEGAYLDLALGAAAAAMAIASSLWVLDISRGCAFSFPLLLAMLARLKFHSFEGLSLRVVLGWVALATLLAPNFEIIKGSAVRWIPSLFSVLFHLLG